MFKRPIRALSFLAPNMLPVYQHIMSSISEKLGCEIQLEAALDYGELHRADLAFVCGLPYVYYTEPRLSPALLEALVAPVLQGPRFENRPIYYSDVIVHRDSPYQQFTDLQGCRWAYNEILSQSGYGVTRYRLAQLGETDGFFAELIDAGYHQEAIRMVVDGRADASAIDTQVLAVELRDYPELARQLRTIDSLGPSSIQPLVAAAHVPEEFRQAVRQICGEMHQDPASRDILAQGFIERLEPVTDADYDDIRALLAFCEAREFLVLR